MTVFTSAHLAVTSCQTPLVNKSGLLNIISLCLCAGGPQGKPLRWPVAGVFATMTFI
uniref:Uncharacterized protein n=1 Tax=Anguilla anguilla TaxID=7936 RepID=A0A0E9XVH1_ANGAN